MPQCHLDTCKRCSVAAKRLWAMPCIILYSAELIWLYINVADISLKKLAYQESSSAHRQAHDAMLSVSSELTSSSSRHAARTCPTVPWRTYIKESLESLKNWSEELVRSRLVCAHVHMCNHVRVCQRVCTYRHILIDKLE